ncbi:MAG: glycine cleavage system protein GcvH [Chloroflexota bacterium]|nr:glycine cleavage system protein GcvH [Dehalococcoidia bacterium]MDW8255056.1 glycine cleavage system protein GcvH [Chloroflexota bacterium]
MNIPEDLGYTKEHEWVRFNDDGTVTMGITEFASEQLGDVVYIDLPAVGTQVKQFEKFGEIESVKAVSELFSAMSGEVIEVNEKLSEQPELVNTDPYGAGWMLRVRPSNPAERENLLTAAAYGALTA